jgi:hypothetical protein
MEGAAVTVRPWRWPVADSRAEGAAIAALIPLLLAVAIWNRFPIIYYDTGAYVLQGLGGVFLEERSPVYSIFLRIAGGGWSLWLVALVQAAMTAFVMVETARAVAPRLALWGLLAITAVLVVCTGLPWYVGQIEPDCLTALVALSLYLLAFHRAMLGRVRGIGVVAVAVISIASHPSHLVLAGGLIAAALVYKAATTWSRHAGDWPRVHVLTPLLSLVLALGVILTANYIYTREIFVSRAGPVFVFARLLQDGIIMRLLDDTCPGSGYRLCAYKDDLPRTADQWLWDGYTPFKKLQGFAGTTDESERMILDSLRRYPMMHLRTAAVDAARQFVRIDTGDQIEPQQWVLYPDLRRFIPGQIDAYMAARQQRGQIDFVPINALHVPFAWLSWLAFAAIFAIALAQRRRADAVFLGLVFLALLGNAVVCGALSNPHDRYQSRLIWMVPFAAALALNNRIWRKPQMTNSVDQLVHHGI